MIEQKARVLVLAGKYGAEAYRRFRTLKGIIRVAVIDNDVFALREPSNTETLATAPEREAFDFPTDEQKRAAFMEWLRNALADEVLEPVGEEQVRIGLHWSDKYLRGGVNSGLRDAGTRLREFGVEPDFSRAQLENLFNLPITTRQLQRLYMRSYHELEDITREVGEEISDALAEGLSEGEHPREIARSINEHIDDGISRARTLARTETAHSYNNAAVVRYMENDISEVNVVNPSPCLEICKPVIDENPYPVEEAIDLIPGKTHPNCVGGLSPATVLRSPAEGIAGVDY